MSYNFNPFKQKIKDVTEWLQMEFKGIRTGRATPTLLDGVEVLSYGARMAINQVGTISVEDAKTLRVVPWDASQVKEIEKAITIANLGLSVVTDDKGLRVIFPDLTAERRDSIIKIARQRLEDAKISLRQERDKVWHDIQEKERAKEIAEDDKFRFKDEMEKLVIEAQKKFEEMTNKKEAEIKS
ncbi:MAG: ribosome recycling factor [Candidatus Pacebacteria bacterium]|nr:ribosome recycling factor [Candidatus Paceibacterota bacterium]